jgi:peptidoglycan/LPS O-acetylase OafA/YrhL
MARAAFAGEPVAAKDNSIGFLRLLLASIVLVGHAFYIQAPPVVADITPLKVDVPTIAVQGFFCISGFLVATSLLRLQSIPRYLWHRFLRIVPALVGCLAFTAFVLTPILHVLKPEWVKGWWGLAELSGRYFLLNLLNTRNVIAVGPYPQSWNNDWNGSLWTLPYEIDCYLLLTPLALLGLLGRWKWVFTLGVAAVLTALFLEKVAGIAVNPAFLSKLYKTPGRLLVLHFMMGSLFALYPGFLVALQKRTWIGPLSAVLLITSWFSPRNDVLSPCLFPIAILWFAYRFPWPDFEKMLKGDYSYGIYIYGYPIAAFLSALNLQHPSFFYVSTCVGLTLALAWLSWHVVEKHALRLKDVSLPRSFSWPGLTGTGR